MMISMMGLFLANSTSPANFNRIAQMQRIHWLLAILKVADVKIGEGVVHKAVHGAVGTVRVLVHQPGDEVRCEGNDKGLVGPDEDKHM